MRTRRPTPPWDANYIRLRAALVLLGRSRLWLWGKLAEYQDADLIFRARHWAFPRQLNTSKVNRAKSTTALHRFLCQVGLPITLMDRLLWDVMQEDWLKQSRRFRRRPLYQLQPWAVISAPSYQGPLLRKPPTCSSPSTGSSKLPKSPTTRTSTKKP